MNNLLIPTTYMFTAAVTVILEQLVYTIQEGAFAMLNVAYEGTIHQGSIVLITIDATGGNATISKPTAIVLKLSQK